MNHNLGMKITKSQNGFKINPTIYARDMVNRLERYLTSNLDKKYTSLMEREFKITKNNFNEMTEGQRAYAEKFPYQNVIEAL